MPAAEHPEGRKPISRYLEGVVLGEEQGFLSWTIRGFLWPLSVIYRVGLAAYLSLYSVGIRKRSKLPVPVISVGNITFGGTGKTPAVQAICRMLLAHGKRVLVLSRGHGGSAKGSLVVSDGEKILCDSAESGDEPMLLAKSLPGIPVVVGKDRRASGRLACESFKPDIIVMDDGLQYWQLHRDLDVVVLNAAKPFGSGFLMPMGDLREPAAGLKRAGIVLLGNSHAVRPDALDILKARLSQLAPKAKCFACHHEPVGFVNVDTGEEVSLSWVSQKTIVAFCGIGRPDAFIGMLRSLGASVAGSLVYHDHHAYTSSDLADIRHEADRCGAEAIVTTAKDFARLGSSASLPNLYILNIALEIEDNSSFASIICDRNSQNKAAHSH